MNKKRLITAFGISIATSIYAYADSMMSSSPSFILSKLPFQERVVVENAFIKTYGTDFRLFPTEPIKIVRSHDEGKILDLSTFDSYTVRVNLSNALVDRNDRDPIPTGPKPH